MKTVLWSLLLGLLMATTASAQPGPPGGDRGWGPPGGSRDWGPPSPEDRVQLLKEALNLDDKQAARLLEILNASDAERAALHKKYQEQIHKDVCALKKNTTGQIKSVLTSEQSAEFDKLMLLKKHMQEQRMHRHFQHRRGQPMGPGEGWGRKDGGHDWSAMMNCEESSP